MQHAALAQVDARPHDYHVHVGGQPLPALIPQPDALRVPNQTDEKLAQIRSELLTTLQQRGLGVIQPPRGFAGQLEGEAPDAVQLVRPGALASHWRSPAKRSAMQSIPDRHFVEIAACNSVGDMATT
jgi:hypothetical protein